MLVCTMIDEPLMGSGNSRARICFWIGRDAYGLSLAAWQPGIGRLAGLWPSQMGILLWVTKGPQAGAAPSRDNPARTGDHIAKSCLCICPVLYRTVCPSCPPGLVLILACNGERKKERTVAYQWFVLCVN